MRVIRVVLIGTLLSAGACGFAAGQDEIRVWIPAGTASAAKEQLNKQTVVGGWLQDPGKEHWQQFMVPGFINHDPDEPRVGAQALVDLMRGGRGAATIGAAVPPGGKARPRFFVIADGDYVAVAHNPGNFDIEHPPAGVDPGANVGGNVFHVVDGKITEWWYYANGGGGGAATTTAQPGADQIDVSRNSMRPQMFGNTPLVYGPGALSDRTEAANKRLVLRWLRDFWVDRHYEAWPGYLRADFRNHDPGLPALGAAALVRWLKEHPEYHSDYASAPGVAHAQLFVLAEGDLVFVLGAAEVDGQFDPQAQLGRMSGNVFRVSGGRIAEAWHAGNSQPRAGRGGGPAGAARTAPAG